MENPHASTESLFNIFTGFNGFHSKPDKALKLGIYNAVAFFLMCLGAAASYALYIVLKPFIKPLIWALLCGAVLFPFKCWLTTLVQSWFKKTESSHRPLVINLVLLPVQILDNLSEVIGSCLFKHAKHVAIGVLSVIVVFIAYYYTPILPICLMWQMAKAISIILSFLISTCNIFMITALVIGYLSILHIYWIPQKSTHFHYTSFALWFAISLFLSNLINTCQLIVFLTLQTLYLCGFVYEILMVMEQQAIQGSQMSLTAAGYFTFTNTTALEPDTSRTSIKNDKHDTDILKDIDVTKGRTDEAIAEKSDHLTLSKLDKCSNPCANVGSACQCSGKNCYCTGQNATHRVLDKRSILKRLKSEFRMTLDMENSNEDADKYLYGLLYACIAMLFWKHKWMMPIAVIPVLYYTVKQFGSAFGIWHFMHVHYQGIRNTINSWCLERYGALIPPYIRGVYHIGIIVDKKVTEAVQASMDTVVTIAVIFGLLIFCICASIFITMQVYAEGVHLVQVTGEILNSSLIHNPDIDWVPQKWEESFNNVLDNAYTHGRTAISHGIKGIVKDLDPSLANLMEKKVLDLWDRLYQAWMMSGENSDLIGPTVNVEVAYSAWESFLKTFKQMPLQVLNMTYIQNFVKENIGTLFSLLDTSWTIIKGNMSVILSFSSELVCIILTSGSAVLNFAVSTIVFFTTLFYLLSSSNETYIPIHLATKFSPISCHRFFMSLHAVVIGVFAATFKLAVFFGMWTWLIHNLFQVKIVYLPSVFATMLGAVPFLDPYFACIPAAIELWLTQGVLVAIVFFAFHFIPCTIVVTDFYKEIKGGGHPYMTGLSIAGGVFCLGVEGAIFGPLLLCCIMVAINVSRHYFNSP